MQYDPIRKGRSSGIVVPLQSLRSVHSPAAGEFPDLAALGALAKEWDFDLVQLLPVNDSGYQTSPYSALSAFALHPLYLSIADLPELTAAREAGEAREAGAAGAGKGAAGGGRAAAATAAGGGPGDAFAAFAAFAAKAADLRAEAAAHAAKFSGDARFRYGPYLEGKLAILEKVWNAIGEPGLDREAFDAWVGANPWVRPYSVFVELKRLNAGKPWWEWTELREPTEADIGRLWGDKVLGPGFRFRAWLQWRAEAQFRAAIEALDAAGVALMGDIPILINEDSADVWARRSVFRLGLAAGAPPDMYAELGQNWGFPIYDWEAAERDGHSFWKERLAGAAKFYSAYRIDHVLGFFRIWALSDRERSGYLGRFVPDEYITRDELLGLGFHEDRIQWLSEPHIRTDRLVEACGDDATDAMEASMVALERIGDEELFLFRREIRGELDIEKVVAAGAPGYGGAGIPEAARAFLLRAWRDRVLFEFEPGLFAPAWRYYDTTAWPTLSEGEKAALEGLFRRKREKGESGWEANGRKLLGMLKASSSMLPCAEDLGSVPGCVPRVLSDLGILGLRVLRWTRDWAAQGQPYVAASDYPKLAIACPSVHDSTSLRGWYEGEADKAQVWAFAAAALGEDLGPAPATLDPRAALVLLKAVAAVNSAVAVYPIQDLLALAPVDGAAGPGAAARGGEGRGAYRPADPADERVNVPGTTNEWNWGWRLPETLEAIAADRDLARAARELAAAKR
jgi:4-alpha-glucanotransferase